LDRQVEFAFLKGQMTTTEEQIMPTCFVRCNHVDDDPRTRCLRAQRVSSSSSDLGNFSIFPINFGNHYT
jgi:cytochrome b involved in lipid metabolism